MDLPGPSSSTSTPAVVKPISIYYAPPLPPQTITPPQLVPQQPQLSFESLPASIQSLALLYPQLFQITIPTLKSSQYLNRSELSAFKEVNDLKQAVNLILPMLPLYGQVPNGITAAAVQLVAQQQQPLLTQNLIRKRTGMQTPNGTQLADCPVSMRTAMNASHLQSVFTQYMMMPQMGVPSPTLPTTNLTTFSGGGVEISQQLPTVDEQAVNKWSSPSSVDSNGQKTDSSTVSASDSHNIDIVGDGSESSSTSTASAQDSMQAYFAAAHQKALVEALRGNERNMIYPQPSQSADPATNRRVAPMQHSVPTKSSVGPERKQRKPVNDDIVKIVRSQDLSPEAIEVIEIPVPKATECDPNFRPVSEQQIIQQIVHGKKYEEMEVGECMIQLCKKLAEKRVFGPRLMSMTTVAGLNHSNYSNLPIKGICYIQHVCWTVLHDRFTNVEDFWEKFRDAMRKLAARCRRVRHAKKTKHNREESLALQQEQKRRSEAEQIINVPASLTHNLQSLGLTGLRPKPEVFNSVVPSTSGSTDLIRQLVLQTFANANKPYKDIRDDECAQLLLQMSGTEDFGMKQERFTPP